MDAAKLAAFMCGDTRQVGGSRHPMVPAQSLEEMYGVDMCRGNRLPLVQVRIRPKSNIVDGEIVELEIVHHPRCRQPLALAVRSLPPPPSNPPSNAQSNTSIPILQLSGFA